MARKYRHIIILILASLGAFSQPFRLSDTLVSPGQFQHLYEIYFEAGAAKLQVTALVQLDSVFQFLIKNPAVKIELGVHTDFRGDAKKNLDLSKKRAAALVEYLVNKGIAAPRIKAVGFGTTKPVIEYEDWKKLIDTHRCGYYGRGNGRVTIVILQA